MDDRLADLRFTVLGPVRGRCGADELDLGPPQQRALLAALLLREGRAASAPELVDALWGDDPPARAVGALRTYVSRLRRLLEPGRGSGDAARVLVTVGGGYALRLPDGALDAADFERDLAAAEAARAAGDPAGARELLRTALGRWRGEPLAGVPGPFAETQRARLAERRLTALDRRFALDLELGDHAEIVAELSALVAEHPLRERPRGLLMLALSRSGRQAEALAVYDDARRVLAEELGIEPGPELSGIHARVLVSPGGPGAPAPTAARPAQLPGDVADFTGRAEQVGALCAALRARPRRALPICAVAGAGGVGKTALALHVAHRVRGDHPDGQLYVDLHGAGGDPAEPRTVLGSFLQALGVARDAVPDGLAERAALYRTRLAGRRVLVLLDNARDAEQVRPLLPGDPGCAVLVTSRAKLGGLDAARFIDLDAMEPAESLALLTRIVGDARTGAEPGAAAELLEVCGHLPLAVRIVAARLAARPSWTVASLLRRLDDEDRRLAELRVADLAVEAVFRLAYRQLDDRQRRAFRLLALADGPSVSREAAAALLGTDAFDAEELCESLVDVSLLRSPTAGRYRYHDLVRLYARGRAAADEPAAERAAALRRLLHFCLATARDAHLTLNPGDGRALNTLPPRGRGLGFADQRAARDWLFTEADTLFAAIAQAARDADRSLLPPAADLLLMTDALVDSGLYRHECEQAAYAVIDAAWERRDLRSEGRAHLQLGWVYFYADRIADAAAVCRTALRRGRETGDVWTVGDALGRLGACALMAGRPAEAVRHKEAALAAFRKIGDRYGEANIWAGLGRPLLGAGRAAEAVAAAERGLSLHRALGSGSRIGYALYQSAVVLEGVGRPAEAVARCGEALRVFRGGRNRQWEGLTMVRAAAALLALGSPAEAARVAADAVAVTGEVGYAWGHAQALRVLGRALHDLGDADAARERWTEALRIFQRLNAPETGEVRTLLHGHDGPEGPVTRSASTA
ncbi:BTAD domain-containing putative transcriptional regulator [Actinomadura namibiensis]|uniref:DNA-binding SARP family transcriptional activator n=1 Tax=Actinomadura namibiensis TaxID=182080 RepID=A0A7W3LZK3_ACTNM|nr:AfsR/SARP family transcriptional regulator [Actinomadura namibiensis]MBA8957137.1 DNA-binding SARP family transcriptional activator [Actinomadura namibiensis]